MIVQPFIKSILFILSIAIHIGYTSSFSFSSNYVKPIKVSSSKPLHHHRASFHLISRNDDDHNHETTRLKMSQLNSPNSNQSDLHSKGNNCDYDYDYDSNRRAFMLERPLLFLSAAFTTTNVIFNHNNNNVNVANAAPPMMVIAEELGYFPVTNREGETMYIPSRVKRQSTDQAVEFAKYLQSSGAVMYGAFWCPHCQRQKEMFGREAWDLVKYVECDGKGYGANPPKCFAEGVDGFPSWKFKGGKTASGEMPLVELVKVSGYKGKFDGDLEPSLPNASGSCR